MPRGRGRGLMIVMKNGVDNNWSNVGLGYASQCTAGVSTNAAYDVWENTVYPVAAGQQTNVVGYPSTQSSSFSGYPVESNHSSYHPAQSVSYTGFPPAVGRGLNVNSNCSVGQLTETFHHQSLNNTAAAAAVSFTDDWNEDATTDTHNPSTTFTNSRYQQQQQQQPHTYNSQLTTISQNDEAPNEFKILYKHVGLIIGKSGSRIRELQMTSGARIDVDRREDRDGMALIRMSGSESSRKQAKQLIDELIAGDKSGDRPWGSQGSGRQDQRARSDNWRDRRNDAGDTVSDQVGGSYVAGFNSANKSQTSRSEVTEMSVPSNAVGTIIGRGGQKIKDLQEDTQTRIRVNKNDDNASETVVVTITGNAEDRQRAKEIIAELLEEKASKYNISVSAAEPTQTTTNNFSAFGGSSFIKPQGFMIDWDKAKELADQHEKQKWNEYPPIKKNFYIEDPDVANLDPDEIAKIRLENNNIMVEYDGTGEVRIPNPVQTFEEAFAHFPDIMSELKRAGFEKPSPIQMQGWPIALQGLDLIGVAQTGTGKTLAFLLPAFIHIEGQPVPRNQRHGPNVLVLSPTRELAIQIEQEVKKYKYRDINCVCVYGGGNRREQINVVAKGVEIVVATPGRLNDLISSNIIDVRSVTYLVLDEADRMLDLGFEPEIRKILIDIRPDRQTIMTSATWPPGVRRLAGTYMKNPIRVNVGSLDLTAVHSVLQRVEILSEDEKRSRLLEFLTNELGDDDKVIVFMGRKTTVDNISSEFALTDVRCQSIHGGREQCDREQALEDLKDGTVRILIATDVASRGLDIKDITHVVNYDFPHNIEEYVHRVGRTGRAGRSGQSLTFMTRNDWRHATELIKIMEEAGQEVPQEVYSMAQRYSSMQDRRRDEGGNDRMSGGRKSHGEFDDFEGFSDRGNRGRSGGRRDREKTLRLGYM